jgi:hypothetical protein
LAALLLVIGCGTGRQQAPPQSSFVLRVDVAGDGRGTISGGPIDCGPRCTGSVSAGAAPVTLVAAPADDSVVSGWSIAGCGGLQCAVTVDRDLTVAVNFARKQPPSAPDAPARTRRLTLALEEDGQPFDGGGFTTVTSADKSFGCTSSCASDFPTGTTIRLDFTTFSPSMTFSRWRLAGWRGPCAAAGDSCTVTLDHDATITALVEVHPRLIVSVSKSRLSAGRGSLSADRPTDEIYRYPYQHPSIGSWYFILELGESVTLTPLPDSGSHVSGWSGPCAAAGTGPCTLTATRDDSAGIELTFDPDVDPRYRLTAILPLARATAMRVGTVVGQTADSSAARYDLSTATVTPILASAEAVAINRRGDVAGRVGVHPFVSYASGGTVVLGAISGRAVALNDGGILLGLADNPPTVAEPTFTFDGSNPSWVPVANFQGRTITSSGVIGGCLGYAYSPAGAIFQNGAVSDAAPFACADLLTPAGTAIGAGGNSFWDNSFQRVIIWDGQSHDVWDLAEANDLAEDGTIAGSTNFDGYYAGHTSNTYVYGLHAALYAGGKVQDLNFVTDTSAVPEVAHVAMERALAIDGGKILVSFRNGIFGVLEPAPAR